jgi:hypothetical protein
LDSSSLSPEVCRQKAEECLALAEKANDPKHKAAMLRFAEWWARLAEYARRLRRPS